MAVSNAENASVFDRPFAISLWLLCSSSFVYSSTGSDSSCTQINLEVDSDDVQELLGPHNLKLTIDELIELFLGRARHRQTRAGMANQWRGHEWHMTITMFWARELSK
ncbi:hypothetical protein TNCV_457981 [Trichonephila clavipes]|nr:hypothetical protein TNCV_457981 [Trichonephila clavipes]